MSLPVEETRRGLSRPILDAILRDGRTFHYGRAMALEIISLRGEIESLRSAGRATYKLQSNAAFPGSPPPLTTAPAPTTPPPPQAPAVRVCPPGLPLDWPLRGATLHGSAHYAARFVARNHTHPLNATQKQHAGTLARLLGEGPSHGGFGWDASYERREFWDDVWLRLKIMEFSP